MATAGAATKLPKSAKNGSHPLPNQQLVADRAAKIFINTLFLLTFKAKQNSRLLNREFDKE
ncbi:MAG: hypothetical protein KAZ21_02910 [Comamonas sp.]|nr:hypothetical protein [Comamonas sp.]